LILKEKNPNACSEQNDDKPIRRVNNNKNMGSEDLVIFGK